MAINQLIAQGVRPIGADVPEIANMLGQRQQQQQQNALAQQRMGIEQQNASQYQRSLDMQTQARDQTMSQQRKAEARDWLGANYERLKSQPELVPQLVQYGKQNGYLDADIPDNAPLEVIAGRLGVQAPVRFQTQNIAGGGILQTNPQTGETKQVVAPDRSDPRAPPADMFSPVDLEGGGIGSFDRRTGRVTDTGAKGKPKGAEDPMKLRKEFESQQSVKDFRTALPLLVSARKAPDNGFGDLQLIYTAGKVLDPGSVVREGELALTVAAGSPLQRVLGSTRFTAEKGGRLTPETRQQLLGMLNERVLAYRQAYDQDRERFSNYSSGSGSTPDKVVGPHPANAYKGSTPAASAKAAPKRVKVDAQGKLIGN